LEINSLKTTTKTATSRQQHQRSLNFFVKKSSMLDQPLPSSYKMDSKFQQALDLIERLRKEDFNISTEKKLASHPYLKAAVANTLTLSQKRAFCLEQFAIQRSDAISFAHFAGHRGFRPTSLASTNVPTNPEIIYPKYHGVPDLFQFLLGGEIFAAPLLLDYGQYLGLGSEDDIRLASRGKLSPLAQAYASYWARLALSDQRAAGAAACAVNFPAWGRMCQQILVGLRQSHDATLDMTKEGDMDKALAFIQFFATPIDNLDEMAAAIIMQDDHLSYDDVCEHVRQLQGCEVLFWDACFNASE